MDPGNSKVLYLFRNVAIEGTCKSKPPRESQYRISDSFRQTQVSPVVVGLPYGHHLKQGRYKLKDILL